LQTEHVIAAELGLAKVEEAVAECVSRLDQLPPRVVADLAVDEQAAALLKGADGEPRVRPVVAVDALPAELEALSKQALLHIRDFSAAVTEGEIAHVFRSWREGEGRLRVSLHEPHGRADRRRRRRRVTSRSRCSPTGRVTPKVLVSSGSSRSMCQSNSHGTRMRWPELEIGRDSVRPCTMPGMIA